jgi:hypothetical protein
VPCTCCAFHSSKIHNSGCLKRSYKISREHTVHLSRARLYSYLPPTRRQSSVLLYINDRGNGANSKRKRNLTVSKKILPSLRSRQGTNKAQQAILKAKPSEPPADLKRITMRQDLVEELSSSEESYLALCKLSTFSDMESVLAHSLLNERVMQIIFNTRAVQEPQRAQIM